VVQEAQFDFTVTDNHVHLHHLGNLRWQGNYMDTPLTDYNFTSPAVCAPGGAEPGGAAARASETAYPVLVVLKLASRVYDNEN
jgi:hypothetical protein